MAGRLSDSDANNMLDSRFGGVAVDVPATYYVGLSTTLPTNTGGNITEPVGNGYARVAVANNAANFPAAAGREKSNGTAITFPFATGPWGSPAFFVLMDAATDGAMRGFGPLGSTQAIATGTRPSFAPGALTIAAAGA